VITTPRLLLRTWRESDRASFAALNADPAVMEFFPSGLNGDESEQTVALMEAHQKEHGFCFFAAELVGKAPFIGFIGISNGPFEAPFTPAVEVGWRLARPYWNRGLATEGATAVLSYAFLKVQLNEVVSFTVPANIRSRRVMEKVGMTHDRAADFDHPRLPAGHPLRRHVLYRLGREKWQRVFSSGKQEPF
jgi:ribosomal-protein-alanine N-acetyltransferase/3-dehydroquinate dehydratase/shikimate dehydrogenase